MTMKAPGERVKRCRWVYTDRFVIEVEVEAVILPGDDEVSYEPETVRFLKEIQLRAEANDREWLRKVGRVYVLESAA